MSDYEHQLNVKKKFHLAFFNQDLHPLRGFPSLYTRTTQIASLCYKLATTVLSLVVFPQACESMQHQRATRVSLKSELWQPSAWCADVCQYIIDRPQLFHILWDFFCYCPGVAICCNYHWMIWGQEGSGLDGGFGLQPLYLECGLVCAAWLSSWCFSAVGTWIAKRRFPKMGGIGIPKTMGFRKWCNFWMS